MPPKTTSFNANMLSRSQKRQLAEGGSFRTSRGTYRNAEGATVAPPAPAMTAGAANAMSTPIASPTPVTQIQPTPTVNLPEPTALETQTATMNTVAGTVDRTRASLNELLNTQGATLDREIDTLQKEQDMIMAQGKELVQPFREKLEKKERERLKVDENFQASQKLVDELDSLLTQSNELINVATGRQVSGKVLEKSLSKTMADITGRTGVIEAVLSARSGQIAQAFQMIDRSVAAVVADRNDELAYYDTLLQLNQNKLIPLTEDKRKIAEERLNLAKRDVESAEKTAEYIKELMINPDTAQFMADSGVSLNDTIDTIKQKMAKQVKVKEVLDTRNALVDAGYEISPVPVEGGLEIEAGGQKIYARVRPGSELDIKLRAGEADVVRTWAEVAATKALTRQREAETLITQAKAGDPKAVEALGYNPNQVNGGIEGAQMYEMQKADLQMGIDAAAQILGNESGIKLLTGAVQSPLLAGATQAIGGGVAGGAGAGTFIGGVGAIPGAIAGAVGGVAATPFFVSRMKLNKDSAIGALNFLVNDSTFTEIMDLKAQGLTFGNMTEGERIAAGRAAERLSAAVVVDESGRVTSISATPDEVKQYVTDLMRAYEGRQEYLNTTYAITKPEAKEAEAVWNEQ